MFVVSPRWTSLSLALLLVSSALADPPKVQGLYPSGGVINSSINVQAVGTFPQWPVEVWSSYSEVTVVSLPEKKGFFQVQIGKEAKPGVCWLRFHDQQGASTLRPFLLSDWRRVSEEEFKTNEGAESDATQESNASTAGEELNEPLVIDGRLARNNEVDAYQVRLRAGDVFSAKIVAAEVLGSPMDVVMQVTDATGRYVLQQNDDSPGLDPRILFRAPQDGAYQVRLFAFPETPNSSIRFAGGDNYIYRLAMSKRGLASYAYPLAVNARQTQQIRLVNLGGEFAERLGQATLDGRTDRLTLFGETGDASALLRPYACDWEPQESDWDAENPARPASLPCTLSGRILEPGDSDSIAIALVKGDAVRLRVLARVLGSSLDSKLVVLDPAGKQVATNDDARRNQADAGLDFKAPADGLYTILISDLHATGGSEHFYVLEIEEVVASFTLTLDKAEWIGKAGEDLAMTVNVGRDDNFSEPIEIGALGLSAGVSVQGGISNPKDESKGKVSVLIRGGEPGNHVFRIVGAASGGGRVVDATAPTSVSGVTTRSLWLTIQP